MNKMTNDEKWNDRLKKRFLELKISEGLTQAELSERLGVAQPTVANWMAGRKKPRKMEEFDAIAEALGVETSWLVSGGYRDELSNAGAPVLQPKDIQKWLKKPSAVDTTGYEHFFVSAIKDNFDDPNVFALIAQDAAMEPRICIGDTIVFNPSLTPLAGSLIGIDFNLDGHVTIGEYVKIGKRNILKYHSSDAIDLAKDFIKYYVGRVVTIWFSPERK